MPGLTVDTHHHVPSSPSQPSDQQSASRSKSSSPARPTYSPITPVLSSAHLNIGASTPPTAPLQQQPVPRTYTHSQRPQTFVPPPPVPPESISLDSNPDALALKAAISILQIQRRKATSDIQTLQNIKQRALAGPEAFAEALIAGQIRSSNDSLFNPTFQDTDDKDDEVDEDENEDHQKPSQKPITDVKREDAMNDDLMSDASPLPAKTEPWPRLPKPQTVVRTPPVNWNQYGIIGPSLDKLHADQLARPVEGLPARIGPDGVAVSVDGGRRNDGLGIAAPYVPSRDKIERKRGSGGGKR